MPGLPLLGEVWLNPPNTYSVHTRPGRRLNFLAGHADLYIDADVQYVLGMPGATLRPTESTVDALVMLIEARDPLAAVHARIDWDGTVQSAAEFLRGRHPPPAEAPLATTPIARIVARQRS
jgi:hypothetical protein